MDSRAAALALRESILASFCSRASRASLLVRSSVKHRSTEVARWVWQLMRPGMATMPVPSIMVWGISSGTFLEMNSIFPSVIPILTPKRTSAPGAMVTAVTLVIKVSKVCKFLSVDLKCGEFVVSDYFRAVTFA